MPDIIFWYFLFMLSSGKNHKLYILFINNWNNTILGSSAGPKGFPTIPYSQNIYSTSNSSFFSPNRILNKLLFSLRQPD